MSLDDRDRAIVAERKAALDGLAGPRVGDFVIFADGTERRISEQWGDRVQTSALSGLTSGRFYLGNFGCSFSGGLYPPISRDALRESGETRVGSVWIFHHDQRRAHNGVVVEIPFRVFHCSLRPAGADRRSRAAGDPMTQRVMPGLVE